MFRKRIVEYEKERGVNLSEIVKDNVTGQIITARKEISKKNNSIKCSIKTAENKPRYFTQKDIDTFHLRQKIKKTPMDERNI